MSRVETIGDCTLYLGDALEILPTLGKVDALIWDPPWGIDFKEYADHDDDPEFYPEWLNAALAASECLVRDGWCVVFQGARRAFEWARLVPREYRVMACAKNFTQILPGKGPLYFTDFALFWSQGTPRVEHGKGRDFHLANTSDMRGRPKGHPCPRPLDQMVHVVNCFTEAAHVVLDPTMGSGTTGVACAKLGRKFIGIEIHEPYFDIACRRIEEAYRQGDMFREPPAPKAVQPSIFDESPTHKEDVA